MKYFFIFFLVFLSFFAGSQNYSKDWAVIQARIDKGGSFTNEELNGFLKKYEKDLKTKPIDKSILLDFLGTNCFHNEEYNEALVFFNDAIELTKQANDTLYRAFYIYDIATLYDHIGYYTDA
jgi:hypothetical protein